MESDDWLSMYYCDFRRRLIKLLAKTFQNFTTGLALSLLDNKSVAIKNEREYNGFRAAKMPIPRLTIAFFDPM